MTTPTASRISITFSVDGHADERRTFATMDDAMRAVERFENRWRGLDEWNARWDISRPKREKPADEYQPGRARQTTVAASNATLFG